MRSGACLTCASGDVVTCAIHPCGFAADCAPLVQRGRAGCSCCTLHGMLAAKCSKDRHCILHHVLSARYKPPSLTRPADVRRANLNFRVHNTTPAATDTSRPMRVLIHSGGLESSQCVLLYFEYTRPSQNCDAEASSRDSCMPAQLSPPHLRLEPAQECTASASHARTAQQRPSA